MRFEFDPQKSARDERERGPPFAAAGRLFDGIRLEWEDRRKNYGETRLNTLGEIEDRVFCVSFTRRGETIRIISFRKANARETRRYRDYLRERSARGED
ncbi:MAG: BrnT family toxin [Rhizomicrobium sp.]|jgi:uncharacterized DUF497 family protein